MSADWVQVILETLVFLLLLVWFVLDRRDKK